MDPTEALPDDALANILCRLPPCDLAASRCVRKAWHALVDARRLFLPHLLCRTLCTDSSSTTSTTGTHASSLAPRRHGPSSTAISTFLPDYSSSLRPIVDHCNGLLLCHDWREFYVVNPAMRRWEELPREDRNGDAYLVFDPAVSLHYEVFFIPHLPDKPKKLDILQAQDTEENHCHDATEYRLPLKDKQEDPHDFMEWPPSLWTLHVFSSSTRQWQKRSFVRQGKAIGTVTNVRLDPLEPVRGPRWHYSVYCVARIIVRALSWLSLSDCKYQAIKMPTNIEASKSAQYIGKSENGVYLATVHEEYRLRVLTLVESSGQIDWVLKHNIDFEPWATVYLQEPKGFNKTWTLDDGDNHNSSHYYEDDNDDDGGGEEDREWNSDDDNVLNIKDGHEPFYSGIIFLGFHLYKEAVFFELSTFIGVAYHLKSSKVQYLGNLRPKNYYRSFTNGIYETFPYTPCMIGELLNQAPESRHRD
ncbi:hypothetical protein BRADI_1g65346v3 [Brachypodium distachyon]|uniref:F-box domain-containing protein n=1 Tax=Brachypodium distachyon TaxID=15368 RepID=A0A0Q3HGV4_BRADI|nr:hypothetical protein BRADI_1g65346v3 [Brachypodium distachyon]